MTTFGRFQSYKIWNANKNFTLCRECFFKCWRAVYICIASQISFASDLQSQLCTFNRSDALSTDRRLFLRQLQLNLLVQFFNFFGTFGPKQFDDEKDLVGLHPRFYSIPQILRQQLQQRKIKLAKTRQNLELRWEWEYKSVWFVWLYA